MRKHISLDTSVLLRAAMQDPGFEDLRNHAQSLLRSPNHYCHISSTVIFEFVYAAETHYGFNREDSCELLQSVLAQDSVEYDTVVIDPTVRDYLKYPKLSFADCLISHEAATNKATPLLTCDRKLANQQVHAELFTTAWAIQ
jgi:predicted nucleic-acid-binding protein